MNAIVSKDTCIGCGLCPTICPDVFELDDDGKAGVIVDKVPEASEHDVQDAESNCPVNAISVEE